MARCGGSSTNSLAPGLRALGGLCAAALLATPASAAWYIKFDGVDGEVQVTTLAFRGGVRVASGDVTGDGTADADADVDGRDFQVWQQNFGTSGNAAAADGKVASNSQPRAIGLLLPAVQKVREAAARRPAGMACKVGGTLNNLALRDDQTGERVRVPVAQISACSREEIGFTFQRVMRN